MPTKTIPRKIFELNKAIATQNLKNTAFVLKTVGDGVKSVLGASRVAGKTVVGQTRSVVDRTVTTASSGAREVTGQVKAQGRQVAATASSQANKIVDDAAKVIDDEKSVVDAATTAATRAASTKPTSGTPYEKRSRAQLLERAEELGIEGRTTMNKKELIGALRG